MNASIPTFGSPRRMIFTRSRSGHLDEAFRWYQATTAEAIENAIYGGNPRGIFELVISHFLYFARRSRRNSDFSKIYL